MWLLAATAKGVVPQDAVALFQALFPALAPIAWPATVGLLLVEATIGFLLLWHKSWRTAATLSALMAMSFVGVNLVRLIDDIPVPCACIGVLIGLPPAPMIGVDVLILAGSLGLLQYTSSERVRPPKTVTEVTTC
jgi:hypothetical protein